MSTLQRFLNAEQLREVNEIYIAVVRKYRSQASNPVLPVNVKQINAEQAKSLANMELAERRARVENQYQERIAQINSNASIRGMQLSTMVLDQLDRAFSRREEALERLENQADKLSLRILNDNRRLVLQANREHSLTSSRAMRDFVSVSRMRITVPYNAQELIEQELFDAYFSWLNQFSPAQAHEFLANNAVFSVNMGHLNRNRLLDDFNQRRHL